MPSSSLATRIARLQREIERLSAEHAEKMRKRTSAASAGVGELDAKRAEMLARRVRQLGEMLERLRGNRSGR